MILAGCDRETSDTSPRWNDVAMFEEPHPGAVHELSDGQFIGRFSAKEHHKAPLGMIGQITKSEDL
jgi:hypothetical protein